MAYCSVDFQTGYFCSAAIKPIIPIPVNTSIVPRSASGEAMQGNMVTVGSLEQGDIDARCNARNRAGILPKSTNVAHAWSGMMPLLTAYASKETPINRNIAPTQKIIILVTPSMALATIHELSPRMTPAPNQKGNWLCICNYRLQRRYLKLQGADSIANRRSLRLDGYSPLTTYTEAFMGSCPKIAML